MQPLPDEDVERYTASGWWGEVTASELLRGLRHRRGTETAYITPDSRACWREYDELADRVGRVLFGLGLARGARVGVLVPDGLAVHAAFVGASRAGVVAVGIGDRSGNAEIEHLLRRTGARVLITAPEHRGQTAERLAAALVERGVPLETVVSLDEETATAHDTNGTPIQIDDRVTPPAVRALGPNELSMLNSTSGTTGLPKCVMQFENRWLHFVDLAVAGGALGDDEVWCSVVPAPYGFGLWSAHFAPLVLGAPTVVLPRFDAVTLAHLIERAQVTVLCCVSTQFRMLAGASRQAGVDLSCLRVVYTGGEPISAQRVLEFERDTGAAVLQFFGSNETGALSATTVHDDPQRRANTAGKVLEHMDVRLFDGETELHRAGVAGQPAGRGPLTCAGYYDDPAANAALCTADGHTLMGDLATIDEHGYLTVVGRTSDLVIRGGKNISAKEVEAEVETHPAVAMVAVVGVPDEVYGERVCAVVTLAGNAALTVGALGEHLTGRGVTRELHPEYLLITDELPTAAGGKVARGAVRELAACRVPMRGHD